MPRPANTELVEKAELAKQGLKRCRNCQEVLPLGSFGVQTRAADGLQPWCKMCVNARNRVYEKAEMVRDPKKYAERKKREKREWIERHPERYKAHVRKNNLRKYGLTPETFDAMLQEQGGKCLICRKELVEGRDLHVDHDHDTGAVRGLLCGLCNVGLGAFRDNPEFLRAAAAYILEG